MIIKLKKNYSIEKNEILHGILKFIIFTGVLTKIFFLCDLIIIYGSQDAENAWAKPQYINIALYDDRLNPNICVVHMYSSYYGLIYNMVIIKWDIPFGRHGRVFYGAVDEKKAQFHCVQYHAISKYLHQLHEIILYVVINSL